MSVLNLNTPDPNGNDTVRIESLDIYKINSDELRMSVIFGCGTTVDSVYTEQTNRKRVDFVGGALITKMSTALVAGDTTLLTTERWGYELLQEDGHVPAGTIS